MLRKPMFKILASFMAILMVVGSCMCLGVSAEDTALYYGDLMYEIQDGVAVITGVKPYTTGDIVIPATIDEYPVKVIGQSAFRDTTTIYSVEIPDSVVKIELLAFQNCDGIESIVIPDTVAEVAGETYGSGEGVFEDCDNLEEVVIGKGLRAVSACMFKDCPKLSKVTLGENVKTIEKEAFANNVALQEVTYPDSLTKIGQSAFNDCKNLRTVNFNNVNDIGSSAFYGCVGIQKLSFPAKDTVIGSQAFWGCESLADLDLNNVITIGTDAFEYCNALVNLIIPESVSQIDPPALLSDGTFNDCEQLKRLVVDGTMTSIPEYTFKHESKLEKIFIEKNNLNSIHDDAFESCYAVKDVYFSGTEAEWKAIASDKVFDENVTFHFNATYDESFFDEEVEEPTEPETTVPETTVPETTVPETTVPADKGILGDVNNDGKVNIKDATTIQKSAAKLLTLAEDEIIRADVNADSKVNVKDATAIQKFVAKIDTGLAIGEKI